MYARAPTPEQMSLALEYWAYSPAEIQNLVGMGGRILIQAESQMKILVIGGTVMSAPKSSRVEKAGRRRSVLVRKPDVKSLPGIETAVGDLLDPVSIEKALEALTIISSQRCHP